jgi:hypothetical protein
MYTHMYMLTFNKQEQLRCETDKLLYGTACWHAYEQACT